MRIRPSDRLYNFCGWSINIPETLDGLGLGFVTFYDNLNIFIFSLSIHFFGLRSAKIRPSDRRENLYAMFYNIFRDIGGLRFGFVTFYDNLDNLLSI